MTGQGISREGSSSEGHAPSGMRPSGQRARTELRVRKMYKAVEQFSGKARFDLSGVENGYINFGYWAPGCTDHDEACVALAERLGEAAGIGVGDRVLDAGFGLAEQDFHWIRTRKPARITGVNITPGQVETARQRAAELGLSDRLDLREASAVSLPFADNSFDRVVALESSVHFYTRQVFFEEAFRVLRPGGVLATCDPLPSAGARLGMRVRSAMIRRRRAIPDANWYPIPVYKQRLTEAGFVNLKVEDIASQTIVPYAEFVHRHCTQLLGDPHFKSLRSRIMIRYYAKQVEAFTAAWGYAMARAEKPAAPS